MQIQIMRTVLVRTSLVVDVVVGEVYVGTICEVYAGSTCWHEEHGIQIFQVTKILYLGHIRG